MGMFAKQIQIPDAPQDARYSRAMLGELLGTGDYLGAQFSQGVEDSLLNIGYDHYRIQSADPNKRKGELLPPRRGSRARLYGPSPDNLTLEEWQASDAYRSGLPFDPDLSLLQHQERARQYDEAQKDKAILEAYDASPMEMVLGFGAQVAGASTSLEMFVPMGGLALRGALAVRAARAGLGKGKVAADIGAGVIEGAAGASLALPFVAGHRAYMGEPMTVAEMGMDITLSALGGGILSGVGGAVARKLNPDLLTSLEEKRRVIADVARGQAHLRETGEMPEPSVDVERMVAEKAELEEAYDQVFNHPTGNPDDPIVHITPEDIEGTIIERGAFKDLTGVEIKGAGYGLVKFIWKHGAKSNKPPHKQVRKEDVTDFPIIIRQYEAQEVFITQGNRRQKTQNRRWVVEREDGEWVVYADAPFTKTDGKRRVVTIHALDDHERANFQLSERKKITPAASPNIEIVAPRQDTNQGTYYRADGGRQGEPQEVASEFSVAQDSEIDNGADRLRLLEMEVAQMRQGGELSPEELAELDAIDGEVIDPETLERAYTAAAVCIARKHP